MKPIKLSRAIARKVLSIVDAGLVDGKGNPIPGQMCVEAAVRYALGLPHGDNPPCVGRAVRAFKIRLNDSQWSSAQARAAGMRKLAVAQLGSDTVDQAKFAELLGLKTCRVFLPLFLREMHGGKYEQQALACERAKNLKECQNAAYAAYTAAAYAAYAAYAAATFGPADAADAAAVGAAAAAAAGAGAAAGDKWLILMANLGLQCLKELDSPGCQWLDLCGEGI